MKTLNISAPDGYHWMQYEGGPVLMVGDYEPHEGASESIEVEVIEEHEPERLAKTRSTEYLEQALEMARKHLPGWAWAMIHQAARGYAGGKAPKKPKMVKCDDPPPVIEAKSLDGARVVFVVADSNELEQARGKLLVGPDGVTFNEVYLKALDLPRSEVAVCTLDEFSRAEINQPVVALGKLAKVALGDKATASMPHPTAIRKLGDSGEVQRKAKGIKKTLTKGAMHCDTASKPSESKDGFTVEITKASSDELRIVYGVVLDPYVEDAHGDTVPPKEVERTAHDWMAKSRLIGLQHSGMAKAEPVESWLVPYPSDEDYQKAMRGEAHNATRTKFGSDTVHSGTWILGTKLGQDEWQAVKSGELNAYSIGGFGKRNQVQLSELPQVKFIDGDPHG